MFTKKQIEEIAAKLADLAIKDSQFKDINKPLKGSESLPILQDGENKLMSLPDLVNLIVGEEDRQYIKCILDIECLTSNAVIEIKGQGQTEYVAQSTYTAYYGEIVDVRISAEGYDTWQEVITMTQDHTLVVSLNEAGGSSPTPTETHYICVTNSQGAKIELNGTSVASGSINYFGYGESVNVVVSLSGYEPYVDTKVMTRDYDIPVTLPQSEPTPEVPYLYFDMDTATIVSDGGTTNVTIMSNIDWVITASDPYQEEGGEPQEEELDVDLPSSIVGYVGEDIDIY